MTLDEYVEGIKGKRIAVLGIGVSNVPLIELLCAHGCDVTACDMRTREQMEGEAERLEALGAKLKLGPDYLEGLDHDILFRTPGLMPFDPHLEAARARGAKITSEMEAFLSLCPCKVIAITGSAGAPQKPVSPAARSTPQRRGQSIHFIINVIITVPSGFDNQNMV